MEKNCGVGMRSAATRKIYKNNAVFKQNSPRFCIMGEKAIGEFDRIQVAGGYASLIFFLKKINFISLSWGHGSPYSSTNAPSFMDSFHTVAALLINADQSILWFLT
jgi:hypothetical protein